MSLYCQGYSLGKENNQFHTQNTVPVQNGSDIVIHNGIHFGKKSKGKKK